MRLIAIKPCSFGGERFFVGDEIPVKLVADAQLQARYGTLTIVNDNGEASGNQSGAIFTQEQVDSMIAEAVAELEPIEGATVTITVGSSDEQQTAVTAAPEEIQQVFGIMQMTAENGAKAIAEVESQNVLILLHASDSRKAVKEAAKKQADTLFPAESN